MEDICVYCSVDVDSRDYLMGNGSEGVYIDGNGNLIADDELELSDIKINFCPMCGKNYNKLEISLKGVGMEQKYFIAYAAYGDENPDLFNTIIYIDEEITSDLIEKIQESLVERLNEGTNLKYKYYATQIVNIVKI